MNSEYIVRRDEIVATAKGRRTLPTDVLIPILLRAKIMTKGMCVYCGDKLSGRRRIYCSDVCAQAYLDHYYQPYIRERLARERGVKCEDPDCDKAWKYLPDELELHHITPLHAGGHPFNDDNLVLLCREHHGQWHRAFNESVRQDNLEREWQKAEERKQKMINYWNTL